MENKTIYRVEDSEGRGPYGDSRTTKLFYSHELSESHPVPICDKGIDRHPEVYESCGFISIKQLLNWFTHKELRELYKLGYKINKIAVTEITAIGEYQVLAFI